MSDERPYDPDEMFRQIRKQSQGQRMTIPNKASTNPNRCETCQHKQYPDGGWCYMFRNEPIDVCMQHTGRKLSVPQLLDELKGLS